LREFVRFRNQFRGQIVAKSDVELLALAEGPNRHRGAVRSDEVERTRDAVAAGIEEAAEVIEIKCAVVENEVCIAGVINYSYCTVPKCGIKFLTRCAGKQADADVTAV
jgi:hypothetical protein